MPKDSTEIALNATDSHSCTLSL